MWLPCGFAAAPLEHVLYLPSLSWLQLLELGFIKIIGIGIFSSCNFCCCWRWFQPQWPCQHISLQFHHVWIKWHLGDGKQHATPTHWCVHWIATHWAHTTSTWPRTCRMSSGARCKWGAWDAKGVSGCWRNALNHEYLTPGQPPFVNRWHQNVDTGWHRHQHLQGCDRAKQKTHKSLCESFGVPDANGYPNKMMASGLLCWHNLHKTLPTKSNN